MGTTLVRVLTTYRALPFIVDHPASPKSGDVCRVGTRCGIAATDELETTSFQTAHKLLLNKDVDPVNGGVYADGTTPVYMNHNEYRDMIRNVSANIAPVGTPIYYYDDPTDALTGNTINIVVGATALASALVGVLTESLAAGLTLPRRFETVVQVPVPVAALTPAALP